MLVIRGCNRLSGEVTPEGAKNSILPLLAASVLAGGECRLKNAPALSDVESAGDILTHLGCRFKRENDSVFVDARSICRWDIPRELMEKMRSSVFFLGPLLARFGEAELSHPGGCELGARPIDMHLDALKAMGVEITQQDGKIYCKARRLRGTRIELPFPSVGATENIIMAALGAEGETVIINAAREPEITELQCYVNQMGGSVFGAGTRVIRINGKASLHSTEYTVMTDRIQTVTYLSALLSAGGEVYIKHKQADCIAAPLEVFKAAGCRLKQEPEGIYAAFDGRPKTVRNISTAPYPGFPTDAQAPVMAGLIKNQGTVYMEENIFENRFRHVPELNKLGADIKIIGKTAAVTGVRSLKAANMEAKELRGSAALIVAALGAEGESTITGEEFLHRGYGNFENELKKLGADIKSVDI